MDMMIYRSVDELMIFSGKGGKGRDRNIHGSRREGIPETVGVGFGVGYDSNGDGDGDGGGG